MDDDILGCRINLNENVLVYFFFILTSRRRCVGLVIWQKRRRDKRYIWLFVEIRYGCLDLYWFIYDEMYSYRQNKLVTIRMSNRLILVSSYDGRLAIFIYSLLKCR